MSAAASLGPSPQGGFGSTSGGGCGTVSVHKEGAKGEGCLLVIQPVDFLLKLDVEK